METNSQEMEKHVKGLADVPIAGIQPLTTIDFPGRVAAVIFTRGCPWACRYCHNATLRESGIGESLSIESVMDFLEDRAGFLDGVVLSGGEPTLHSSLPSLLKMIRSLGFQTAIHTNGNFPGMLQTILGRRLIDYVAMDVKAPPRIYDRVTGGSNTGFAVSRSIDIILSSGVEYEFRTTFHPAILTEQELMDTVHVVAAVGARRYYLQQFRSRGVADPDLVQYGDIAPIPENVINEARRLFDTFEVR
ncbi:MAG: anaerobic ribonucleoside-triphosphate reductase activating protein [Candidatus Latescibacteria bacterium]|nr:anaerobic ribonucleoside-triphosphate reductase activating protein [Candidatus Latescibacterota bacterium]